MRYPIIIGRMGRPEIPGSFGSERSEQCQCLHGFLGCIGKPCNNTQPYPFNISIQFLGPAESIAHRRRYEVTEQPCTRDQNIGCHEYRRGPERNPDTFDSMPEFIMRDLVSNDVLGKSISRKEKEPGCDYEVPGYPDLHRRFTVLDNAVRDRINRDVIGPADPGNRSGNDVGFDNTLTGLLVQIMAAGTTQQKEDQNCAQNCAGSFCHDPKIIFPNPFVKFEEESYGV